MIYHYVFCIVKEFENGILLGIGQQTLSQYEKNKRKLPIDLLISYSKIFNVSIDYIMGITDNTEIK